MQRTLLILGLILCWTCQAEENPRVVLETELGAITIEVMIDAAPISGGDFLAYVEQGLYPGEGFYRVVRSADNDNGTPKIDVIQGGVLEESKRLEPVAHETTDATGITHTDGTISLARGDVGTGSAAYFFITVGDQPSLDFGGTRNADGQGFAAFGRVVAGMDVVRKIHELDPELFESGEGYMAGQVLKEPIKITGSRILPGAD